jgi:hypothetical protein
MISATLRGLFGIVVLSVILSACGGVGDDDGNGGGGGNPNPTPTNQRPAIGLIGDNPLTILQNQGYAELGANVSDPDGDSTSTQRFRQTLPER